LLWSDSLPVGRMNDNGNQRISEGYKSLLRIYN
jgi:hypothetical protein